MKPLITLASNTAVTIAIFTGALVASESVSAQAFIKVDKPRLVQDIQNGAEKIVREVGNGVEAVGNATGISSVIKHNTETIAHIGRLRACMVALCYSEVKRKAQIDAVEAEQKARLASAIAEYEASLASGSAAGQLAANRKQLLTHKEILRTLQARLKNLEKELHEMEDLKILVDVNKTIRSFTSLSDVGAASRPVSSVVLPVSEKFKSSLLADTETAFPELEADLVRLSKETGSSVKTLRNEVYSTLNEATLDGISLAATGRIEVLTARRPELVQAIAVNQSRIAVLEKEVAKGLRK